MAKLVYKAVFLRTLALMVVALARPPGSTSAGDFLAAPPPQGVVTLDQALAAALVGAPSLSGFAAELRVREAEAVQASLRPNPEVTLEQENFGGTGSARAWNEAETTLGVLQPFELGGKRDRRVELAALDRRLTEWDHAEARRAVLVATAEAFVRTLAAQERVLRARELVELERVLRDTVERGVRAGAVSPVDGRRATLAVERAASEVERLEQDLGAARLALAASWGASTPSFEAVHGDLTRLNLPPPLDELLAKLERMPGVSRWRDERERGRAGIALEDARTVPDLRVGVGLRHLAADGDVALVASFGLPLPLFDRNQGAIEAARRSAERGADQAEAARVTGAALVRALHQELAASFARADRLVRTLVPEAEAVYRDSREAYQRGLFRLTDVLDTQRALFEVRLELLDELERHHRAAAVLQTTLMEGDEK